MATDKPRQCLICQSKAETEAVTSSLADMERIINRLEREVYGITLNEQKWFKKEFSIHLIEFEAWCESIGIQALQETVEQCVIHFGYRKIHHVSPISGSIWQMGSVVNFTTQIWERLHITNVKEADRSSNRVNCIRLILKHNDKCTALDYMEETLSYLALQGWYNIDCANVFNLLSTTEKRLSTRRAHFVRLQNISGQALHPCCITVGISFDRNTYPQSVQKYQINLTQRCIRRFRNSQLWTAIPCVN